MAAMATNNFGWPAAEICVICGSALITSWKSLMEAKMVRRLW
jgi:hypothetical protein